MHIEGFLAEHTSILEIPYGRPVVAGLKQCSGEVVERPRDASGVSGLVRSCNAVKVGIKKRCSAVEQSMWGLMSMWVMNF